MTRTAKQPTPKTPIPDESQNVERKQSLGLWREIVDTCAAFASSQGGNVYVGVKDDGTIMGVQIGRGTLEDLANKIGHNTSPKVVPAITSMEVEGKTVLVVEVKESETKPVYAFDKPLRRSGRTNQLLSGPEAAELYLHSRGRTWDYTVMTDARPDDLTRETIKQFMDRARSVRRLNLPPKMTPEQLLKQLKLVRGSTPTVAGILLFSQSPVHFLPQATVRCARFKGDTETTFVDMRIIEGNVLAQVDGVMDFVQRNLSMAVEIVGEPERKETWEYPLAALREAVINAICHRDYSSSAGVQVRIFDDRLEIWNPGGLPPELSIRDLRSSHASIPRNKLIADAFFLAGYVEQFGTGTRRMIEQMRDAGLPEPDFQSRSHFFRVTFRKPVSIEKATAHLQLNDRQLTLLKYLQKAVSVTRKECELLTGASSVTTKRDLTDLVKKHVVVRRGATRNIRYELSDHLMTRKRSES